MRDRDDEWTGLMRQALAGDGVPVGTVGGEIEQKRTNACVREMGCNSGAHGTGTKNCDALNRSHSALKPKFIKCEFC